MGDHNVFEPRSRTPSTILVSNYCKIGACCTVLALPSPNLPTASSTMELDSPFDARDDEPIRELLKEGTVVYGSNSTRRVWSGKAQIDNLFEKHLSYLQGSLPNSGDLVPFKGNRT